MKRKYNAFTLIELLIVIVIIGILAGLIIFALRSATLRARDAKAKSSARSVQSAVETYMTDNADLTATSPLKAACGIVTLCTVKGDVLAGLVDEQLGQALLDSVPLDGQNKTVNLRIEGPRDYTIVSRSAYDAKKCWWISTTYDSNIASSTATKDCPAGIQ